MPVLSRFAGSVAAILGTLVALVRKNWPPLIGVAGIALVCYGLGLAWLPLGFIAAGAFLIYLAWEAS